MRSFLLYVFIAVMIVCIPGRGFTETSNRVVAVVNDDVITLYELNKKIEEVTGQKIDEIRAMNETAYLKTRREILELMINEKLTQEKVEELGIQATQSQIDSTIEDIKKANQLTQEDLLEGLKREGITYEKYRETIKNQIERARLIDYEVKSKILIREEQIKQYYQEHQELYKIEPTVHIAGIFLKRENLKGELGSGELRKKAEALIKRLRNGEDFGQLAREFSQGPGAEEGGDLGSFKTTQIDPQLLKVLEGLQEGEVSDPIERENGIHIIKLISRKEAGVRPFEEVRDSIYETLYRKEVNKRYASWIKDLRENTFTRIVF